jgi:electron transfer flavoprotein alpha subunit
VVWTGPGADAAQPRLAEYGAAKVYVADSGTSPATWWRRPRSCWRSWSRREVAGRGAGRGTTEGKEIAGRLAVKTGSGVLTDAVT